MIKEKQFSLFSEVDSAIFPDIFIHFYLFKVLN